MCRYDCVYVCMYVCMYVCVYVCMLTNKTLHSSYTTMLILPGWSINKFLIPAGVPENKRDYSTRYNNDDIGTGCARSVIDSPQAWSAKKNEAGECEAGEWIQLDLGKERRVAGTVIQPRFRNETIQYVTEYTVSTSLDGQSWTAVPGKYNGLAEGTKENKFSNGAIVVTRYVRMTVTKWINHISLRADVLIAAGKYIRNDKRNE